MKTPTGYDVSERRPRLGDALPKRQSDCAASAKRQKPLGEPLRKQNEDEGRMRNAAEGRLKRPNDDVEKRRSGEGGKRKNDVVAKRSSFGLR